MTAGCHMCASLGSFFVTSSHGLFSVQLLVVCLLDLPERACVGGLGSLGLLTGICTCVGCRTVCREWNVCLVRGFECRRCCAVRKVLRLCLCP
jgi:hypothetical protein